MIPEEKKSIRESILDLDHSPLKSTKNIIEIIMINEKEDKEVEAKIEDKEVEAKTNKEKIEIIEAFLINERKSHLKNNKENKIKTFK